MPPPPLSPDRQPALVPDRQPDRHLPTDQTAWEAATTAAQFQPFGNAHRKQTDQDLVLRRAAQRHKAAVIRAAQLIEHLPEPGCTQHLVLRGAFEALDILAALVRLKAPVTIDQLAVATFGFSHSTAHLLDQLLTSGTVARCWMLCSLMFAHGRTTEFKFLADVFRRHGQTAAAVKNHAKIFAALFADGTACTYEGSANLQRCHNSEIVTLTADPDLARFHRDWIRDTATSASRAHDPQETAAAPTAEPRAARCRRTRRRPDSAD